MNVLSWVFWKDKDLKKAETEKEIPQIKDAESTDISTDLWLKYQDLVEGKLTCPSHFKALFTFMA